MVTSLRVHVIFHNCIQFKLNSNGIKPNELYKNSCYDHDSFGLLASDTCRGKAQVIEESITRVYLLLVENAPLETPVYIY